MALTPGTKLGVEITGLLGKGGMGEVYRARDSKLGREVAIKALPEAYAMQCELLPEAHPVSASTRANLRALGFEMMRRADTDAMNRFRTRAQEISDRNSS